MQLTDLLRVRGGHVALVVNAGARSGSDAVETARRRLGQVTTADVRAYVVHDGAELARTLDAVLAEGPTVLWVGGGDGTVSCAAQRVAGTDVVLGVLPLGTANDFARTLGVPAGIEPAIAALHAAKVVDVDLGRAGKRTFLNVASLGLSVGVTRRLRPGLKKRLGPLAYPVATLAAYRGHRPFAVRLDFPDGDHEPLALDDQMQVAIGNGRHYGGGNTVSPTASLDDHLLDVYCVSRGRLRDHVSIARFLKDGSFVEHERVHHVTTRRVTVTTDVPQAVNLDGEISAETPLTFAVERNALHVVVPEHSRAATLEEPRGV